MQTPGKWSYKQQGEILLRQSVENDTRVAALPADLVVGLESSYSNFREAAVGQLGEILKGKNLALARAARMALEQVAASDDSRRVAQTAAKLLEAHGLAADQPLKPYRQTESAPGKAIVSDQLPEVKEEVPGSPRTLSGLPRPGWIVAFWMTLTWTLGLLGITMGGILANYALNGKAGELPGNIIASVLGGLFAGLAIVLTLRHYGVLRNQKSLVIIPCCFMIGIAIIHIIAITIGNSIGNTPAFVMGYSVGGAVGGAFVGLGVALALSQELGNFKWQSWLWIIASHIIGFAAGPALVVIVFSGMEYQVGSISSGAISGAFGGLVAGACAGIGTIYRLRKEFR